MFKNFKHILKAHINFEKMAAMMKYSQKLSGTQDFNVYL